MTKTGQEKIIALDFQIEIDKLKKNMHHCIGETRGYHTLFLIDIFWSIHRAFTTASCKHYCIKVYKCFLQKLSLINMFYTFQTFMKIAYCNMAYDSAYYQLYEDLFMISLLPYPYIIHNLL